MFGLRGLVLGMAVLLSACAGRGDVRTAPVVAVETVTVAATPARQVAITMLAPARPRAVVLFSHAGSGSPELYGRLFERLNAAGYAVLAPLHVDSRAHPDVARYTIQSAFPERMADMAAAARLAGERYPGLPVAAMGHSYGSWFAQMQGGALAPMMDMRVPGLKAVVSFSSPGVIPGLIDPATSFAQLNVPTLLVTGTRDLVPGFVSDPAAHLASHRGAPAGRHHALVIPEADHFLITSEETDPAAVERALAAVIAFLDGFVLDQTAARARLARLPGVDRR